MACRWLTSADGCLVAARGRHSSSGDVGSRLLLLAPVLLPDGCPTPPARCDPTPRSRFRLARGRVERAAAGRAHVRLVRGLRLLGRGGGESAVEHGDDVISSAVKDLPLCRAPTVEGASGRLGEVVTNRLHVVDLLLEGVGAVLPASRAAMTPRISRGSTCRPLAGVPGTARFSHSSWIAARSSGGVFGWSVVMLTPCVRCGCSCDGVRPPARGARLLLAAAVRVYPAAVPWCIGAASTRRLLRQELVALLGGEAAEERLPRRGCRWRTGDIEGAPHTHCRCPAAQRLLPSGAFGLEEDLRINL